MEKELELKTPEVTYIEIKYSEKSDITALASTENFVNFILESTLKSITKAIEKNLDKIELFNIVNLSLIVELDKSNFKSALETIIQHYLKEEDYDKCAKIQSLINKL